MALHSGLGSRNGFHLALSPAARRGVIASAAKSGKGFGGVRKQEAQKSRRDGAPNDDKQMFKEAAAAMSSHRPVKPEEAARGKLDYVQVADWGDGDRGKLGELRLVSHVQQYEGGAAADAGGGASAAGGGRRPFHLQLAHQLQLAEARGALAVAGPPPPPVSEWGFREERYAQYLADQLEVHSALEAALLEATASTAAASAEYDSGNATGATAAAGAAAAASANTSGRSGATQAAAAVTTTAAPSPPAQGALVALRHLAPGRLGLERSAAIRRDLTALRDTVGHPAAREARRAVAAGLEGLMEAEARGAAAANGAEPGVGVGSAEAGMMDSVAGGAAGGGAGAAAAADALASSSSSSSSSSSLVAAAAGAGAATRGSTAGPMARSYAQVLRRLGRVAASGEGEQEREGGALRLLAHAAVLHLVAQAVWVRVGAAAAERLALLQRGAAGTYHEYPREVTDPRVTLSRALDAAGEHLRSPAARQVVYDEVAGAMQKTGLLLSALAHRD